MDSSKVCIVSVCLMALTTLSFALTGPQKFVNAHNAARNEVGVAPLVWNNTLAAYARKYVAKRSADCAMEHSEGPYGENIAAGSWNLTAQEAVDMWIGEKKFYNAKSNTCDGGECLHYTQVVWANTKRVGCARAKCQNGWTFVSCNYDPPGNYIGERPY
ncbi:basic form of pathogenesis-related protein 1-like [Olea europaea var. sylvestris]|uniref:Basic form of pathogenesis-related 1-like n=1 Tax=Olea europaea subsp. europaea TaxID=158383 RepID=A0A8S0SHG6_OLEEU|nr:basic form of pathogenesis-related protein 1-like [Olea europaea var. sylvestris]CAA2991780.1 basic form of pathogenesis-related 1-like [Olea europaea subsp. europaea]